jgi:hypothetical protein
MRLNKKRYYNKRYGLDSYAHDFREVTKDFVFKHFLIVKKKKNKILNNKLL